MAFLLAAPLPIRQIQTPSATACRRRGPSACEAPPTPPSLDATLPLLNKATYKSPPLVHLVGTGPGDPGLLTLHALRLLQTADVVLYDRLISPSILRLIRPSATTIYVGKQAGFHTRPQQEIHMLLAAFAAPGKVVVRLKGGDPFVFGRGGEEAAYLKMRGIRVNIVPGITAASGIAASLGIPLTQRAVAAGLRFLTGHMREGAQLDVGKMCAETTMVVYMGLGQLPKLVEDFARGGLSLYTPAVAVERGTTLEQRVVATELGSLVEKVQGAGLQSPTLVIIGEVVRMGDVWEVASGRESRLVEGIEAMAGGATWGGFDIGDDLDIAKVLEGLGAERER